MDTAPGIFCQHCGKPISKAYGVRLGFAYCQKCYTGATDANPCPGCGGTVRQLKGRDPEPCRTCQNAGRLCLRCGKPTPRAHLTLENGVACKVCAKYFKPPRPCPCCGQESLRLARDKKAGFTIPVCERCRKRGFITCPGCHKHRRPAGQDSDGRVLCVRCLEADGAPFVCPRCNKEGVRHSASRCEDCYWNDSLKQRAKDAAILLRTDWTHDSFVAFARELGERVGGRLASLRLQRYLLFFLKLEASFKRPELIDSMALTRVFGPEGLRRFAVPWGFMVKSKVIPAGSAEALADAAEFDRQEKILAQAADAWYAPVLERYQRHQLTIHERYQRRGWTGDRARYVPKTVTKNLQVAAKFLAVAPRIPAVQCIEQSHFDMFCLDHPGYRNAIRGFVRYLNTKEKLFGKKKLKIPTVQRGLPEGIFLGSERHRELIEQWSGAADDVLKESLICLIMMLYAQPVHRMVRLKLRDLIQDRNGGFRLAFGQAEIELHEEVAKLMDRWLAVRAALATMEDDWNNPFLFPGRGYGSHLSAAAMTYHLKKHGVTAEQLFATAIHQAYLHGVRNPKVLVKGFGITSTTAQKYLSLLAPELRDELDDRKKRREMEEEVAAGGEVIPFDRSRVKSLEAPEAPLRTQVEVP